VKRFVFVGVVSLLAIVALFWGSQTSSVSAIEGGGIGGVPANPREDNARSKSIFVYKLDRGESIDDAVQVINNTPGPKTLQIYAVDAQVASGGAFACAQKVEKPIAAGSWIDISEDEITLAPGSKKNVSFKVTVPNNAVPGEQNGCIVIQDANSEPVDQGNGIKLSFRSAIRVAVTVPGEISKDLDFTGFDITELDNDKIRLTAALRNNGNVSLDTNVRTNIKTFFGSLVRSAGGEFPVLAESEAQFNFEVDQVFWGGWYKAQATAEYNSSTDQSIGEGSSDTTIYSEEKIIFIAPKPQALLIETAAFLIIVGGAAYYIYRQRQYKNLRAKSKNYTVKKSDSLNAVAKHHDVSWKLIAKINGLKAPYHIKPGDKLKIPPKKSK
jgi:nucleoid-associated protein YgaU